MLLFVLCSLRPAINTSKNIKHDHIITMSELMSPISKINTTKVAPIAIDLPDWSCQLHAQGYYDDELKLIMYV